MTHTHPHTHTHTSSAHTHTPIEVPMHTPPLSNPPSLTHKHLSPRHSQLFLELPTLLLQFYHLSINSRRLRWCGADGNPILPRQGIVTTLGLQGGREHVKMEEDSYCAIGDKYYFYGVCVCVHVCMASMWICVRTDYMRVVKWWE